MVLKKITVPLYRDYEVTTAVREVGIRSGYRPECSSALQCVASLFRNTNETANFWTHFLPSVYFTFHLLSSFRAPLSLILTGLISPSYSLGSSLPSFTGLPLSPHIHWAPLPSCSQGSFPPSYSLGSSPPSYSQGSLSPLMFTGLISPLIFTGLLSPLIFTGLLSPLHIHKAPLADTYSHCPKAVLHKSKVTTHFPTVGSTDSSHWPYLGYLLTVTAYLWASCGAHAFCSLSLRARNICYFVDYLALSVFSFGSAMLYMSYSFPQHFHNTRYEALYLPVAAVLSMACIVMACSSRSFAGLWSQKCLRILSFVLPYMWDNLPLVYRVSSEGLRNSTAGSLYLGQFLAMMLATFFYGTHIPERLAPGKFDCLGELSVSPGTYKALFRKLAQPSALVGNPGYRATKAGRIRGHDRKTRDVRAPVVRGDIPRGNHLHSAYKHCHNGGVRCAPAPRQDHKITLSTVAATRTAIHKQRFTFLGKLSCQ
uniref:Uncharacterized protein n=1 Tax=Timema tahoe TaxID=61484 RepID=A0A7R9NYE6_9NEOP|nr:unnamed protein product [Timema tahoe]